MKTAVMKLNNIQPADYNPRINLAPGDDEYEALKNSLEKFGVVSPLVVNERTGNLVSGHQRLSVLIANGIEATEVVLVDMDERQEKLCSVALNKIEGDWDYTKLQELIDDISADGFDDLKYTGFTTEEIQNLFGDVKWQEDEYFDSDGYESNYEQVEEAQDSEHSSEVEKEFRIYLSFPSKEIAEEWLAERNLNKEFSGGERNIVIRMKGVEYGSQH